MITIILPCYNEVGKIYHALNRLLTLKLEKQVIVVDDGSTDGTRLRLANYVTAGFPDLEVIYHERNKGKGAALQTGLEKSQGDIIVFFDADLEYSPADIPKAVEVVKSKGCAACYGSRMAEGKFNPASYLANRFLTKLTNLLTGLNLTDMETGLKVFNAQMLKSLALQEQGFGIEPEITIKLAKAKHRIEEIPIEYNARGKAQGKKIRWLDGVKAIFCILRYAYGW